MGKRPKQIEDYELVRGNDLQPGDYVQPFYDLDEQWQEVESSNEEQIVAKHPPGGRAKYGRPEDRVFIRKKE